MTMHPRTLLSRLHPQRLKSWWRELPSQKRIRWIATIMLLLAGAEVLVVAPAILELAVLIDAFGVLFVVAAARTYLGTTLLHLWRYAQPIFTPFPVVFRTAEAVVDFGAKLPTSWYERYLGARTILGYAALSGTAVAFFVVLIQSGAKGLL